MVAWSRPPATRSLRLISLNVNGLSSAAKRKALFARLCELKHDVTVLQETHSDGDETAARGGGGREAVGGKSLFFCNANVTNVRGMGPEHKE